MTNPIAQHTAQQISASSGECGSKCLLRGRAGQALFSTRAEIEQLSYALLEPLFPVTKGIRLLGMTLSSLGEKQLESEPQLSLSF